MSAGAFPIDGIRARISSIESRFEPDRRDTLNVMESADFDPFGEAYQNALDTRMSSPVPTSAPAGVTAYRSGSVGFDNGLSFSQRSAGSIGGAAGVSGAGYDGQLVTTAINGMIPTGPPRPAGGYGAMPVPPELQSYGNGQIPTNRLTTIGQSGHRLYAPAAAAWEGVVAAAKAEGFDLRITDSYRTYDQQVDLAERKGLYKNGGLAATPGKSNHGWGMAVDADLLDPKQLAWMRANGPRFGWVESVPREPWHWEFRPHQV